jgi:hypothetical protein
MCPSVRRRDSSASIDPDKPVPAQPGDVVPVPAKAHPRTGWADASKVIAASGDDELVWPEFASAGDEERAW